MTAAIRAGLSYAEYDALPGIRSSWIKAGRISMLQMRDTATHPDEPSESMETGTLIHTAVLEPDRLLRQLAARAIWGGRRKQGEKWDEFEADNAGKVIVTRAEHNDQMRTVDAVLAAVAGKPEVKAILAMCQHETAIQWEGADYGPAKYRADGYKRGLILEVKSSVYAEKRAFLNQFCKLGYPLQIGWGVEGAEACGDPVDVVYCIRIQNKRPWDCGLYKIPPDFVAWGRKEAVRIAREYRRCEQAGKWPGVQEGVGKLEMPEWMRDGAAAVPTETMEASEL